MYIPFNQLNKREKIGHYKFTTVVNFQVAAGNASVTPPLGPLLGQYGINIIEFCSQFNTETAMFLKDLPISVVLHIAPDRQFYFEFKTIPSSVLLKNITQSVGNSSTLLLKSLYNIALFKLYLFSTSPVVVDHNNVRREVKQLLGTFRSLKFNIEQ